ncbi:hypothetical protein Lal_00000839 [Lupinus albus]|nr:hypothetical protein Lal_00000839 [Lupinus albus]
MNIIIHGHSAKILKIEKTKKERKKVISEAKDKVHDGLYKPLGSKVGERSVYILAKGGKER